MLRDGATTPHAARGGTIINVITVVIFFGLLALGIWWIMKTFGEAGQQYTDAMITTSNRATDLACQSNLHAIKKTLQTYMVSNESYPESREELMRYAGYSRLFRCPDPNGSEYVYIPGQRADMPPGNVLVYESKPVHEGRCNVLLLSGQIESLTPDELKRAVEATLAELLR